jgi:hypothetical protein
MSFAPLHYRKLRIAEHGAFALLPLYVRCFGEGLKKLCDDRGRIVLDGRAPADVIARRGGAETNERRRIAGDINELIRVGWLREEDDALVVVEQEQDWEQLDSSRALNMRPSSSRRGSERHPTRFQLASDLRPACSQSESSARNHSADHAALIRSTRSDQQEERRSSPIGEGVQGEQVSETDPTPTLRKQQLDEAIGKGPADWGMEGSSITLEVDTSCAQGPEQQTHPTPRPAPPSPPAARPAPVVAGVDHKPVQGQIPPAAGVASRPSTLLDLGPPNAPRKALAKKPTAKKAPAGTHAGPPQSLPLPEDWAPNDAHYEFGRELGLQKKHVDYFAGEMRDRAVSDGWVSGNWNAKFRNFMRKGLEFRRGEPPVVPDPLPPKRPMPPCPPPPPEVLARAEVWKQRMEAGELPDLSKLFKPGKFVVPPVEKVEGFNGFAEECTG